MKFAFCIFNYYPYGGLERSFLGILKEAVRRGHEVVVYTMQWQGETVAGATVKELPVSAWSSHGRCKKFVHKLQGALKDQAYDLVVGFNRMPGLDLYYSGDVSFIAKSQANHGFLYSLSSRYRVFSQFEKAVFSTHSKTHIMTISSTSEDDYRLIHNTPQERLHRLPPGIDKAGIEQSLSGSARQTIRKQLHIADEDYVLIMIGSDYERKGLDRTLAALSELRSRAAEIKVKLLVIGRGDIDRYQQRSAELGVRDLVEFLGPKDDRFDYLAAADIVLHPALHETAGNVILEGLIAGKPVMVTAACGFAVHVERSGAGAVIADQPFSVTSFAEVIRSALDRDKLDHWKVLANQYCGEVDLYSRPKAAMDIAENLVAVKQGMAK